MTTPLALAPRSPLPPNYVGWVKITTPRKRTKVRFVRDGLVYRDDAGREPARPRSVACHALACRVVPVEIVERAP